MQVHNFKSSWSVNLKMAMDLRMVLGYPATRLDADGHEVRMVT